MEDLYYKLENLADYYYNELAEAKSLEDIVNLNHYILVASMSLLKEVHNGNRGESKDGI